MKINRLFSIAPALLAALFVTTAVPAATVATVTTATAAKPPLKTTSDSLSYAIGLDCGEHVKQFLGDRANAGTIAAAIEDVLKGRATMTRDEAQAFLQEYFSVRMPMENLRRAENYMKIAARDKRYTATPSGLLYEIVRQGDMSVRAVSDSDEVTVKYVGTFTDGTQFDRNDEGISFRLDRVISGWTEGMKLVGKGGRIRLVLPPALGYGERGASNRVPANSVLLFDVELIDVKPSAATDHAHEEED